jgi:hypothetical protein
MYENGRMSVTDAERSGRPATATTTNEERTLDLIRENIRITVSFFCASLMTTIYG